MGEAAAVEFSAFLKVWRELPHPRAVIADPENAIVPDNASALIALCGSLYRMADDITQANQAVFFALLRPGDRILTLELGAGGHLSHGAGANLSGRWFDAHHYGVDRASGLLDYDAIEARAREVRPVLLIAGGSAYPRAIDFERMGRIAEAVEARLLVDMAHIAGLVAAGAHASPVPHADIVTCTTTKTLRGPRGGIVLARSEEFAKRLQAAVFPGIQGSLHSNVLAAKAVCLGEALRPEFGVYGQRVVENARTLAATLAERGIGIVADGTDTGPLPAGRRRRPRSRRARARPPRHPGRRAGSGSGSRTG